MRTENVIVFLSCIAVVGVSFGFYRQSSRYRMELQDVRDALAALGEKTREPAVRDRSPSFPSPIRGERLELDAKEIGIMQVRVAELEEKLAHRDQLVLDFQEQLQELEAGKKSLRERMQTSKWTNLARQRMEILRERLPEEYQKAVENRKSANERLALGLQDRLDLFGSIDAQGLSPEYLKNHKALLIRIREFRDRMAASELDPDSQDAWQSGRTMFQEYGDIGKMMNKERDILLNDFAVDLGFSEEDATVFVDYMVYVNDMTSPRAFFRSLRKQGW